MIYKTVAGPVGLTIGKSDSYEMAVSQYASIINREAQQGWELAFIQEVPVEKDKGCLAGCLAALGIGARYETMTFNMLVFANKNDNAGYTTQPAYSNTSYVNYGNTQYNAQDNPNSMLNN